MSEVLQSAGPTITSLPVEVLTQISLCLDRNSALSLARVARAFTFPAEHRIYRDLDLFLPASYGEYPLVQPHRRSGHGEHLIWAKAEATRAEERHREGLRDKIKKILVTAGARRLGLVEKVTVVWRPRAVYALLSLLDAVSGNLKSLVLSAPAHHVFSSIWSPAMYESLDVKLIDYNLAFSQLTSIRIDRDSLLYAETILVLCNACPNVTSLNLHLQSESCRPSWDDDEMVPFPPTYGTNLSLDKLLYLRAFWYEHGGEDDDYHPIVSVIEHSPRLQQVSLAFHNEGLSLPGHLVRILGEKDELQSLYMNIDSMVFGSDLDEDDPGFPSLTNLVMSSVESELDLNFFESLPALPNLESIYVERAHIYNRLKPPKVSAFPEPNPAFSMLPQFAAQLRNCPVLSNLSSVATILTKPSKRGFRTLPTLDEIMAPKRTTGIIRSLVHGHDELLHARLFLEYFEIADQPRPVEPGSHSGMIHIEYTAEDAMQREKIYERQSPAQWQDFVEWAGYTVPLDILQKMRVVQGATLEEWQGRGVEVGDAAWKVLTDWRDAQEVGVPGTQA